MHLNLKVLKHGLSILVTWEALSLLLVLLLRNEFPPNDVFPRLSNVLNGLRIVVLLLLVLPVNLPGLVLARRLGLFSAGGWNPSPNPHPVAGWLLAAAFSTVVWSLCILSFARALRPQDEAKSNPVDDAS